MMRIRARTLVQAPRDRFTRSILYGIVAVAALMRLPSLLHDGLFRDEANVYVVAMAPSFAEFFHRIAEVEWHPPLFFLLAYFWIKAAGTSELALKGLPFLFGVLTVPVIYRLGRTIESPKIGLVAAAMYAVSPLAVSYSTSYVYPLAGFLFVLLACLVAQARQAPATIFRLAALALVTTFATYVHYAALFYLPALAAWAVTSPRGLRHSVTLALAMLAGFLPFLFWLPVFVHQHHVGLPYQQTASLADRSIFFLTTLFLFVPVRLGIPELPIFIYILFAGLLLTRRAILKSSASAVGAIFLVMVFLVSATGLDRVRYVFPAYGLQCVFLALIVWESWQFVYRTLSLQKRRWAATAAVLLILLFVGGDVGNVLANSAIPRSGIRTFAAEGLRSDTLYVLAPDYLAPTFAYYARNAHVAFLGFARVDHPEILALEGYAAVWQAPEAVDKAVSVVERTAKTYRYVDVIVDDTANDAANMPYGKTWQFLERIKHRYRLVSKKRYAGVWEPVTVYGFAG
jgi:4-amino-4-deoxy-L-arabinose transferase-like glycosyltransferase